MGVIIGRLVAPHGVKGELRLMPLTDFPDRFNSMKTLDLYSPRGLKKTYKVIRFGQLPRGLISVKLEGVDSRDDAELLRDWTVQVAPEDRVPLEEGQYWVSDLQGLNVFSAEGELLGTVKDVHHWGANDTFEIVDAAGKDHYVPFVDQFVQEVNLKEKKVVLKLIEGLWE